MSADDAFLKRIWPKIKKAMDYLSGHDGDRDGVLEDGQPNTLDTAYFGPNSAWLALCTWRHCGRRRRWPARWATRRSPRDCGRSSRAARQKIVDGRPVERRIFLSTNRTRNTRKRCKSATAATIDQVFGQSWAFQVGLGRILPEDKTRQALRSLWKYNLTPDVGPYRKAYTPTAAGTRCRARAA